MRFHGRLSPGVLTDPDEVVRLVLHAPDRCPEVTLKVWELDTFVHGEEQREGSEDDLLATFVGAIEPGDGDRSSPEWRRFVATEVEIAADDPDLVRFKLQLPGSDVVHEIPIVSEEGELEGGTYELGFSLEVGGEQVFKSQAPCFFTPPRAELRVVARSYRHLTPEGDFDPESALEEYLTDAHVAIGVAAGAVDLGTTLKVIGVGYVDEDGYLIKTAEADAASALLLRRGRPLFLFTSDDPIDAAGEGQIALTSCDPVEVDDEEGVLFVVRYDPVDPMSFNVLERPMEPIDDDEDPEAARLGQVESGPPADVGAFLAGLRFSGSTLEFE